MPISRHDARVGVPNLLSAEGFDLAWTQHMTLTLNRLNQLVAGESHYPSHCSHVSSHSVSLTADVL
jgi:superoxide dismutase, Fe-Mn family